MWCKTLTILTLPIVLALTGCGDTAGSAAGPNAGPVKMNWGKMRGLDKIVGNMNDDSYSQGRSQEPRPNALAEPVSMTDFEGQFVWAEYAAPWCKACGWQAKETKKVENELGDDIVFLTVMTSRSNKYNDHATVATARSWSGRHGLDEERVVAAQLWAKTIPEHRFYSPQGHTLFVHVGSLTADQIRRVIERYKADWEGWAESNELATWMSLQ